MPDVKEPGDAVAQGNVVDPLGSGIDDRVQFNVEMVDARYCSDLAVYWGDSKVSSRRTSRPTFVPSSKRALRRRARAG